ncbi:MAG: Sporulation integral membrane protein YlbJ [Planctomycetes bacterium ADurb.Bin412]|nr:MAG: Sporulation integral membrane protein YlbJ [Planctomycetes bacterium ADurb.Bin412]
MVQLGETTRPGSRRRDLVRILWTACVLIFVISMIRYPSIVFQGALAGLKTWWNIVFPALLPFFIASELLMNFGVVHFMGVLLEPVMRPLFNVPGAGSFVMAIGYTSGYPIGSMVTARLRSEGLCSRAEAERLMSFTNNSSPLFMLVAVAVGMFNNPRIGIVIAGAHYLSNLILGLVLRYYARSKTEKHTNRINHWLPVGAAIRRMLQVQRDENRPVGKIMGDAVRNAVTNLLNIGGFIILFAVIIQILSHMGFIDILAGILGVFLLPLGFSPEILPALGSGFFEMTIGSKLASEAAAPLLQQIVAIGMILAWSGLSVHAQAASMIAGTDIRMLPFVVSRLAHTCLAGIFTCLFCRWMLPPETLVIPALAIPGKYHAVGFAGSLKLLGFFLIALIALCLFSVFLNLVRNTLNSLFFKRRF